MDVSSEQFRAARGLLGYSQLGVERLFELPHRLVQILEAGKYKLLPREAYILKAKYESRGVLFTAPSNTFGAGVRWKEPRLDPFDGVQTRGARGLVNISQPRLAALAHVDRNFITRVEQNRSDAVTEANLQKVRSTLIALGVEFVPEDGGMGAGVRWAIADRQGRR